MNLNLTPCAFPAELAKGTTAQSVTYVGCVRCVSVCEAGWSVEILG